jgi:ribonuclease D
VTEPVSPDAVVPDSHAPDDVVPERPVLRVPSDGIPAPITAERELADAIAAIAAGTGPVAVDAERASGYRYSQRAYLIQLRRAGTGTILIDPIELPDLSGINEVLADTEWILHAANQDLACLAEVGLVPRTLFDTELAGRLLGDERVALGTMIDNRLGVILEKGHSAADWSTRPLPVDWLAYAALDVELLVELRDLLAVELRDAGKWEWAEQEFAAVLRQPPPAPRTDPWRRTSGMHQLRSPRQLAIVRALWQARDELARSRDRAPGRVLPDGAIVSAATLSPASAGELLALPVFRGSNQKREVGRWFAAISAARALDNTELPPIREQGTGIPATSRWRERDPIAAARLARVREAITALSVEQQVPAQNLLAGDVVRRIAWEPPEPEDVRTWLLEAGARPWQADLSAPTVAQAIVVPPVTATATTLGPEQESALDPEPAAAETDHES